MLLLGRLRIRGKLALLVAIPLLAIAGLTVPVVTERIALASGAAVTARVVNVAGKVGSLIQDVQQERLLSIGYAFGLVDQTRLALQTAAVTDRITDVRAELGSDLSGPVSQAMDGLRELTPLRAAVLDSQVTPDQVLTLYGLAITRLIDSLRVLDRADASTVEGKQIIALDAVIRAGEGISNGAAMLAVIAATKSQPAVLLSTANLAALQVHTARFTMYGTPEQVALYNVISEAFAARLGADFITAFSSDVNAALARLSITTLFPSLESVITLSRFVEKKIVADVLSEVTSRQRQATLTTYGVAGLSLAVLLLAVLISVAVARAVAIPLGRLTLSANRVAGAAESELVRVADDDADTIEPVHLDPVDVRGRDEIGDLARAFERIQRTAADLVERQVAGRRNVAEMFGHIGRRTQNLVGRQLNLIDQLERDETDPRKLQDLYRLDHISNRLRRNASSLVVLSGSGGENQHTAPVLLQDVVRLALGEIEDFVRVDIAAPPDLAVAPGVVGDLVLVLGELMENATAFSPPHSRVSVFAAATGAGLSLDVVDHGIGMPEPRMAEENARFAMRERLDLAPTELLGLFVVGRLARRHGFGVRLSHTPGGGVTVTVELAKHMVIHVPADQVAAGTALPLPPAGPAPLQLAGPATLPPARQVAGTVMATVSGPPIRQEMRLRAPLAVAAEPAPLPPLPFDVEALERASQMLARAQSWNAFAPAPAGDAVEVPAGQVLPVVPAGQVLPVVPMPAPELPAAGRPPKPAETSKPLRRRVRGAQLPLAAPSPPEQPVTPADAVAAKASVEQFQAGVRRAQGETDAGTATPSDRARLSRRVPGASLAALLPQALAAPQHPARSRLDPDLARDLIEQFESGVQRALRDAGTTPDVGPDEGSR